MASQKRPLPITEPMRGVLDALKRLEVKNEAAVKKSRGLGQRWAWTHNEIAMEMGHIDGGRRHGNGANRSTSGLQAPANRVIFPVLALEKAGLVRKVERDDGWSGLAVEITTEGRKA